MGFMKEDSSTTPSPPSEFLSEMPEWRTLERIRDMTPECLGRWMCGYLKKELGILRLPGAGRAAELGQ